MANLVPADEELFKKIESEHIQVPEALWNVIYQYIGDPLSVNREQYTVEKDAISLH